MHGLAAKRTIERPAQLQRKAILLPQPTRSPESGSFKNVAFKLCGASGQFNPTVVAHDWFQWSLNSQKVKGADVAKIDAILEDPEARTALLQRLSEKIKSERDRQRMSACA